MLGAARSELRCWSNLKGLLVAARVIAVSCTKGAGSRVSHEFEQLKIVAWIL